MKYYVVSDLHGFDTCFRQALEQAGFFRETEPHKLVVCGDILDRGREAKNLVDFLIELLRQDRLIYILGNHEDLLVQCLQQILGGGIFEIASGMSHHYTNGTWDSLLQLGEMDEKTALTMPYALVSRVRQSPFYQTLLPAGVDYYETDQYIFTHGWIPCHTRGDRPRITYRYNPNWREAAFEDWRKAKWFNGMELACKHRILEEGKTVVCGHFHASYGHAVLHGKGSEFGADADFSPFFGEGVIALDACTAVSGKVNCVVLEDEEKKGETV